MMKRFLTVSALLLIVVLSAACNEAKPGAIAALSIPHSWIDSPLNGSTIPLAPIDVVSHSTDPLHIVQVELSVNSAVVRTDPNTDTGTLATMRQQWVPPAPGDYTLQVRAQNSASIWGDYSSKVVTVAGAAVPKALPPPVPPVVVPPVPTTAATTAAAPSALPPAGIAFTVDKTSLVQGQCTTLHWQVTNASQVFLDNAAANMSGSKQDCPTQSTTHTLRVITLDKQTVQRTVTISIVAPTRTPTPPPPNPPPQTGCSGTPNIASFTASPTTISAGGSSTLSWGAVTNANAVEIDQGIGGIGTPGSTTVSPGGTTTYTLTAHCGNNATSKQVTITVTGAPPPPPPQLPTLGNPNSDQAEFFFNSGKCGPKQVTISVNSANASSVKIYFRLADKASSGTTSWTQAPMFGGGTWSRTFNSDTDIPGVTSYFHAWFQFYFVATNAAGDTSSAQYNNMVTLSYCSGIG